jgi:hypothetical protein
MVVIIKMPLLLQTQPTCHNNLWCFVMTKKYIPGCVLDGIEILQEFNEKSVKWLQGLQKKYQLVYEINMLNFWFLSSSVAVKHNKFIIQIYTYLRGYMFRLRAVIFRPFYYIQNYLIRMFKMHMGSQCLQ